MYDRHPGPQGRTRWPCLHVWQASRTPGEDQIALFACMTGIHNLSGEPDGSLSVWQASRPPRHGTNEAWLITEFGHSHLTPDGAQRKQVCFTFNKISSISVFRLTSGILYFFPTQVEAEDKLKQLAETNSRFKTQVSLSFIHLYSKRVIYLFTLLTTGGVNTVTRKPHLVSADGVDKAANCSCFKRKVREWR